MPHLPVSITNKQGRPRSAQMCGLLWWLLNWYNNQEIYFVARLVPVWLNVLPNTLQGISSPEIQQSGNFTHKWSCKSARGCWHTVCIPNLESTDFISDQAWQPMPASIMFHQRCWTRYITLTVNHLEMSWLGVSGCSYQFNYFGRD